MKKTTLLLIVILAASNCIGQEIQKNNKRIMTQDDFMRRSKNQKTAGIIMLVGGAVSMFAGGAIMANDVAKGLDGLFRIPAPEPLEEPNNVGPIMTVTGIAAMIGGAIFLGASKKNKKRAMVVSIMTETMPGRRPQGLALPSMPVASLSIRF